MLKSYYHRNFLQFYPHDNFIRHHNLSMVKYPSKYQKIQPYHNYIYIIREDNMLRQAPSAIKEKYDHVVPGNDLKCTNTLSHGTAFWWNNWNDFQGFGGTRTFFLIGDHRLNKYDRLYTDIYSVDDVRICDIDNNIYVYSTDFSGFYKITNIKFDDSHMFMESISFDNIRLYAPGKNFVLTDVNTSKSSCEIQYLDWFYRTGVRYIITDNTYFSRPDIFFIDNEKLPYYGPKIIVDDFDITPKYKYPDILDFDGLGSYMDNNPTDSPNWGITPMLSFGTPLVAYTDLYIGVGHLKIHSDQTKYPYLPGSNIDQFRQYISSYMQETYGDRYIEHYGTYMKDGECQGYMYLIYFYLLRYQRVDNGFKTFTSMYISDGYLPLSNAPIEDEPYDNDYKFSLYFPMGLVLEDKTLIVSCGYGDYYSCFLEYNVDDVISKCKHDINTIDFNDYGYHLDILDSIM